MATGTLTISSVADLKIATVLGFHPGIASVQTKVGCARQFRTRDESKDWVFADSLPCIGVRVLGAETVFTVSVDGQEIPVLAQGDWELTMTKSK